MNWKNTELLKRISYGNLTRKKKNVDEIIKPAIMEDNNCDLRKTSAVDEVLGNTQEKTFEKRSQNEMYYLTHASTESSYLSSADT